MQYFYSDVINPTFQVKQNLKKRKKYNENEHLHFIRVYKTEVNTDLSNKFNKFRMLTIRRPNHLF